MPKALCIRRSAAQPRAFGDLQIFDYLPGQDRTASVALIQVKAGAVHGRSRSTRSDRYCYVLNGLVEFDVDRITYWLAQGDLLVIPRGEWYNYRNAGSDPATLLVFHTPPFELDAEEFAGERGRD